MHMQGLLQGVHAQGNVHSRAVGEEGSQGCLHKQAKDQDPVPVGQKQGEIKAKVGSTEVWTEMVTEAKHACTRLFLLSLLTSCLAGRESSSWFCR